MTQFLSDKKAIRNWLKKMEIKDYIINKDLTVDVNGSVELHNKNLTHLSVQFGVVKGVFDVSKNKLISLKGSPTKVGLSFVCRDNKLKSLQYCPQEIKYDFFCDNNNLTTLKFLPATINGSFNCSHNHFKNLMNGPKIVNGDYICTFNNLVNLEGIAPEIKGTLYCSFSHFKIEKYLNINLERFLHVCNKEEQKIKIFHDLYQERDKAFELIIGQEIFHERMNQLRIKEEREHLNSITQNSTIMKKVKL